MVPFNTSTHTDLSQVLVHLFHYGLQVHLFPTGQQIQLGFSERLTVKKDNKRILNTEQTQDFNDVRQAEFTLT